MMRMRLRVDKQRTERLLTHQMEALIKIANILVESGHFEQKCKDVMNALGQVTEVDLVALWQANQDGLELSASVGRLKLKSASLPEVTEMETLANKAFKQGRKEVVNKYSQRPDASPAIMGLGIESLALIPINANGRNLGLVEVASREANHFNSERVRLLTAMADSLGTLLDNARLDRALSSELTQRQATEEVLKYSEAFRSALLESNSQGIIFVNDIGKITEVNAGTLGMFGYRRDELIGQPVEMLLPADLRDIHATYRGTYFSNPNTRGMGAGVELAGRRKDGTVFSAEIGLSYIQQGGMKMALAFLIDLTDRMHPRERTADEPKRTQQCPK